MIQFIIKENEAGQRLDKFLLKYLNKASSGFIYKMLRKKNIVLNGTKSSGNEKLTVGDEVKLFLSQETIEKFRKSETAYYVLPDMPLDILYENKHVCFMNKPAGMLSQKAKENDISVNEYFTSYLIQKGELDSAQLTAFHPAVCNRLDRNTSGIIIGGKTLYGLQAMSELLKQRAARKYYLCIVDGILSEDCLIRGYLTKNEARNQAEITKHPRKGAYYIETNYHVLGNSKCRTLLEVLLITGRPHQIRAHLASIGHPVIGDVKYGQQAVNQKWRQMYQLKRPFLHSYRFVLPDISGDLSDLSGREVIAPLPEELTFILEKEGLSSWLHGIPED